MKNISASCCARTSFNLFSCGALNNLHRKAIKWHEGLNVQYQTPAEEVNLPGLIRPRAK